MCPNLLRYDVTRSHSCDVLRSGGNELPGVAEFSACKRLCVPEERDAGFCSSVSTDSFRKLSANSAASAVHT